MQKDAKGVKSWLSLSLVSLHDLAFSAATLLASSTALTSLTGQQVTPGGCNHFHGQLISQVKIS